VDRRAFRPLDLLARAAMDMTRNRVRDPRVTQEAVAEVRFT
jgi:hypothetical protein